MKNDICVMSIASVMTHKLIGNIQRRLAWPLRKDDTPKSRMYHFFVSVRACDRRGRCRPGRALGIMAEWLRRQTRNLVGSALVGSNPADVVRNLFAFCNGRDDPKADTCTQAPQVSCVYSTRVVFNPSKVKIRVRVPVDAHGGLLYMVAYNLRKVENRDRYPDPPSAAIV